MGSKELVLPERYKQISRIGNNIIRIRREQGFLRVRQIAISRTISRLRHRLDKTEDEGEKMEIKETLRSSLLVAAELKDCMDNFNGELERFRRGLLSLRDIEEQSDAFRVMVGYISEDTDYTIRNLSRTRRYYDRLVSVLHNSIREDSAGTQTTDDDDY